jgi:hypothetical protein
MHATRANHLETKKKKRNACLLEPIYLQFYPYLNPKANIVDSATKIQ